MAPARLSDQSVWRPTAPCSDVGGLSSLQLVIEGSIDAIAVCTQETRPGDPFSGADALGLSLGKSRRASRRCADCTDFSFVDDMAVCSRAKGARELLLAVHHALTLLKAMLGRMCQQFVTSVTIHQKGVFSGSEQV